METAGRKVTDAVAADAARSLSLFPVVVLSNTFVRLVWACVVIVASQSAHERCMPIARRRVYARNLSRICIQNSSSLFVLLFIFDNV